MVSLFSKRTKWMYEKGQWSIRKLLPADSDFDLLYDWLTGLPFDSHSFNLNRYKYVCRTCVFKEKPFADPSDYV